VIFTVCPPPPEGSVCIAQSPAGSVLTVSASQAKRIAPVPVERHCPIVQTKIPLQVSAAAPVSRTQVALN